MKKAKKTTEILLLILLILFIAIIIFYVLIDVKGNAPKWMNDTCKVKEENYMERKIFIIETANKEKKSDTKILYFHGGSYMAEASERHWEFIKKLVEDTGATVIMPDYPLAPRYNYKDVFKMVEPLYKDIINKIDTNQLIIMGDSAGGGLGLALEEKIGEDDLPMPRETILISPWLDVRLENPDIDEVQKNDKLLNKDILKLAGISYAGNDGIDSYLVNPIEGDLSKLKNVTILIGTDDILNPDVKKLAQKDTSIEVKEYEGAGHIWMIDKNSSQELIESGYQQILELIK